MLWFSWATLMENIYLKIHQFSSVQSLSCVRLFSTPWIAARQASLSITNSQRKEFACNAGDQGLIPGLGRSSGEGNGNLLQCPCLENPLDRGDWWATGCGMAKSRTWLSNYYLNMHVYIFICIGLVKNPYRFFHKMLLKNLNRLFGQPNINTSIYIYI